MIEKSTTDNEETTNFGKILRKAWPCFLSYGTRAFSVSVLYINIYVISTLI